MRSFICLLVLAAALTGCSNGSDPAAGDTPAATETPPLPQGSELVVGEFEYVGQHLGHEIRLGVRFTDTTLTRLNQHVPTATEEYTVLSDAPGRVLLELHAPEQPPKQRELAFDGPDVLFDPVAPEIRYTRVVRDEGSGSRPGDDGSGAEPESEP